MKINYYLLIISMVFFTVSCDNKKSGITVEFPKINEPVQLLDNGKELFYASYYGINSFSKDEKYATVLETDIKYRLPTEDDPATLGLVDLETREFIPLTTTRAWNFQQGCMAHWLATSPDSLIIYNDLRNGKFVSIIMNVHSKEEIKIIPYPVSAVSPNGKEAISINFSRIRSTRADYGYGGEGQDDKLDEQFPDDDGLFLVNLETGEGKLIVSIAQVKEIVPDVPEEGIEYFNHTLFSREGSKVFWLARATPNRNTTSLTVNRDGSNLQRCFPDNWDGSHFDWLNDNELMITSAYNGKQYGHTLFTIGKQDYKRLGNGLLDFDGHGTFSPNKKWMVTDTYPKGGMREQSIFLMDMETEATLPLGRFVQPKEFNGHWRCDIHCRWSPSGKIIGFNSTHTGSRQAYVMYLE